MPRVFKNKDTNSGIPRPFQMATYIIYTEFIIDISVEPIGIPKSCVKFIFFIIMFTARILMFQAHLPYTRNPLL